MKKLTFDEKVKLVPGLRHWEAYKQSRGIHKQDCGCCGLPPSVTNVYESIYGAGSAGGNPFGFGGMF